MANEVTRVCNLQVSNGVLSDQFMASGQFNQITPQEHPDVIVAVATGTGTQVPIGAVTPGSEGAAQFQNMDQTNYADLGIVVSAVFQKVLRLYPGSNNKPGPPAQFDFSPGVTLWVKAGAGTPPIKMLLIQL